ncbi:MAG: hypothetical protein LBC41_01695, partial [Clostridiales bacterium]|nr:hypothetical protein [Clostridiales bacterium]
MPIYKNRQPKPDFLHLEEEEANHKRIMYELEVDHVDTLYKFKDIHEANRQEIEVRHQIALDIANQVLRMEVCLQILHELETTPEMFPGKSALDIEKMKQNLILQMQSIGTEDEAQGKNIVKRSMTLQEYGNAIQESEKKLKESKEEAEKKLKEMNEEMEKKLTQTRNEAKV